ncbi:DUF3857 domain-containing protein [Corallococcus sp. CA053C]|uniref:DUF3857 and transglutaminase domain-containing protein n=1 Tax=Corallococcus sp. CA053C TaxID=2316732 RepID=UPI000EA11764|nr:DUF3857 and transglutaminase domain-containing protein [Corallococcus sp. CA053C]RKH08394.1 DUF3857 domain-containing protein [Corallococcus sp. CA053C]
MPTLLFAAATDPGLSPSNLIWIILILFGLFKHREALQEASTNRKAIYSLVAVEIAALVMFVSRLLKSVIDVPFADVLVPLVAFVLLLLGLFLAVTSLMELRSDKERRLKGRTHAGWAAALSVLLLGGMGFGFFSALSRQNEVPAELRAEKPDEGIRDEEFNFAIQHPGKPWMTMNAQRLNPLARFAMARGGKTQMFFIIIPEKFPDGEPPAGGESTELLADIVTANLESGLGAVEKLSREPHAVGELKGIRLRSRGHHGQMPLSYVHWVYTHEEHAYQLMVWGSTKDEKDVFEEADRLFSRFSLVDPQRKAAPSAAAVSPLTGHSTEYGYSVELDGRFWERPTHLAKEFPEADFGATGDNTSMVVVPLWLFGEEPSPDALDYGLLSVLGADPREATVRNAREVTTGKLSGRAFTYEDSNEDGGVDEYELRVFRDGDMAYLLAGWWAKNQPALGTRVRSALDAVKLSAPSTAPRSAAPGKASSTTHARAFSKIALYYNDREDFAAALPWFKRAFELEPGNPVLLINAAAGYGNAGQYAEGLALINAHAKRFRGELRLDSWRAYLLVRSGRETEGFQAYASIFPSRFTNETHLGRYLSLLQEKGRVAQALQVIQQYRTRADSTNATLMHAGILRQKGVPAQAAAILRQRQKREGYTLELSEALADTWLEAKKPKLALEVAEEMVSKSAQSPKSYQVRARAEYALKRHAEAKSSLEKALELEPSSADTRQFLEHVSGMLGQGVNSVLKTPIEEVALPPDLLVRKGKPAEASGHNGQYLLRATAISFVKGKELRTTDLRRVQVHNTAGVERYNTFEFELNPLSEEIFVNRVEVRDERDRVVARGKVEDCYVSDKASAQQGTQRRTLVVPVPGLKPGHTVDVVVTRRDLTPPRSMHFLEHDFFASIPTSRAVLYVRGDVDAMQWRASPGIKPVQAPDAWTFVVEQPAIYREEGMQPDYQEYLPMAWIAPVGTTWEAEGTDYLKSIAAQLAPASSVKALAAREGGTARDEATRAAALARWVQKSLTYRGILFGARARIPHAVDEILSNRTGDCKDHSLLLHQLLGAAGIASQLALVRTGGPIVADAPSLDQFDHMVVYLPTVGGGTFVDVTDKSIAPMSSGEVGLGGREALVLEGAKSRLVRIPVSSLSHVRAERHVRLQGTTLRVKEQVTLTGGHASAVRYYLSSQEPSERAELMATLMGGSRAGVSVTTLEVPDLDEPERPLTLKIEYVVRGRFASAGGGIVGQLPSPWEHNFLSLRETERRDSPFEMRTPLVIESVTHFEVPAGQDVTAQDLEERSGTTDHAEWKLSSRLAEGVLTRDFRIRRARGRYEASKYTAYKDAVQAAIDALEQRVSLRGPASAAVHE